MPIKNDLENSPNLKTIFYKKIMIIIIEITIN